MTKRLTYKKIVQLVNDAFNRLEITKYEAFKAERTRYRGQDYEAGATTMHISCREKGLDSEMPAFTIYSFYWRSELEAHINAGAVITIQLSRWGMLDGAEIVPVYFKISKNT
jgi:hypothetical protein